MSRSGGSADWCLGERGDDSGLEGVAQAPGCPSEPCAPALDGVQLDLARQGEGTAGEWAPGQLTKRDCQRLTMKDIEGMDLEQLEFLNANKGGLSDQLKDALMSEIMKKLAAERDAMLAELAESEAKLAESEAKLAAENIPSWVRLAAAASNGLKWAVMDRGEAGSVKRPRTTETTHSKFLKPDQVVNLPLLVECPSELKEKTRTQLLKYLSERSFDVSASEAAMEANFCAFLLCDVVQALKIAYPEKEVTFVPQVMLKGLGLIPDFIIFVDGVAVLVLENKAPYQYPFKRALTEATYEELAAQVPHNMADWVGENEIYETIRNSTRTEDAPKPSASTIGKNIAKTTRAGTKKMAEAVAGAKNAVGGKTRAGPKTRAGGTAKTTPMAGPKTRTGDNTRAGPTTRSRASAGGKTGAAVAKLAVTKKKGAIAAGKAKARTRDDASADAKATGATVTEVGFLFNYSPFTQLYTYMCVMGLMYGVLSTGLCTWFVERDVHGKVSISQTFKVDVHGDDGTSMGEMVDEEDDDDDDDDDDDEPTPASLAQAWVFFMASKVMGGHHELRPPIGKEDLVREIKVHRAKKETTVRASKRGSSSSSSSSSRGAGGEMDKTATPVLEEASFVLNPTETFRDEFWMVVRQHIGKHDVVVKVVDAVKRPYDLGQFKTEQRAYLALHDLWGKAIPDLVLAGPASLGRYVVATRYAGESLSGQLLCDASVLDKARNALLAVHAGGYLHGDVEAHNVVVDVEGRVRIVDFSKAKPLTQSAECDDLRHSEVLRLERLFNIRDDDGDFAMAQ